MNGGGPPQRGASQSRQSTPGSAGHVEAYPWDDLVRYAEFHRGLEDHVLAGLEAGRTAEDIAAGYAPPEHLADFSFGEPFASNFVRLLYSEAQAAR